VGADAVAQRRRVLVLGRQPVAGQMVGRDGVEPQVEHQPPGFPGAAQRLRHLLEHGGVGCDPRDRGEGTRVETPGRGQRMFPTRNIRAGACQRRGRRGRSGRGGNERGGSEPAPGHQTAASAGAGAAAAANSSRRHEA
jgi:hypothetical protein